MQLAGQGERKRPKCPSSANIQGVDVGPKGEKKTEKKKRGKGWRREWRGKKIMQGIHKRSHPKLQVTPHIKSSEWSRFRQSYANHGSQTFRSKIYVSFKIEFSFSCTMVPMRHCFTLAILRNCWCQALASIWQATRKAKFTHLLCVLDRVMMGLCTKASHE